MLDKNKNNNEKNSPETIDDEQDLDLFFDNVKETKLKKTITKAKRRSIIRNIFISVVVVAVLLIGGSVANRQLNYNMERPTQIAVDSFNLISAPNKYIGEVKRYQGFLSGKNEYTTYKLIEGKVVYTGEGYYTFGVLQNDYGNWIGSSSPYVLGESFDIEDLKKQRYNELGQREMVFFYPFINYNEYKNDLLLLDQIEENKIMEFALSFDQAYSMEQVKEMIPEDVTLAWYWIDDMNNQEKEEKKSRKVESTNPDGGKEIIEMPARIVSENRAYGIKSINENGDLLEEPEQDFFWALKHGKEYDTRYKWEFERVYNHVVGEDGELSIENIKVFGVVVTGDRESLKELSELPFIKASSLGVIVDRY